MSCVKHTCNFIWLRLILVSGLVLSTMLLALPGVGPTKADRYGEALIEVVSRQGAAS